MRNWRLVSHKMAQYHTSSQAPLLRYVCKGQMNGIHINYSKKKKKKLILAISNILIKVDVRNDEKGLNII